MAALRRRSGVLCDRPRCPRAVAGAGRRSGRRPHRADGVRRLPQAPGLDRVRYTPAEQDALLDAAVADLPLRAEELKRAFRTADAEPSWTLLDEGATGALLRDVLDDLEQSILLIKHGGFAEEREVRKSVVLMVDPDRQEAAALESRLVRYRATRYGIAPYLRLTGGAGEESIASAPSPLPVRGVAISPSPNGPAAEASIARLLRVNGYPDVPVVRSTIPFRE